MLRKWFLTGAQLYYIQLSIHCCFLQGVQGHQALCQQATRSKSVDWRTPGDHHVFDLIENPAVAIEWHAREQVMNRMVVLVAQARVSARPRRPGIIIVDVST